MSRQKRRASARPDPGGRFLQALGHHARNRPADAERGYRAVLEANPDHEGALRFLGLLLAQRDEVADALAGLPRRDAHAGSRPGEGAFHAATGLAAMGRGEDALAACRRALEADPAHPRALVLLAGLLRTARRLDEAVSACRRAVRACPSWSAHNELGLALAAQERVVEAVTALERAVELAPHEAQVRLNLGNVLLEVGELQRAYETFGTARDLEPNASGIHNNLAVAALGMGRWADAARASRRAIALEPSNPSYRYNLAFSLLAQGDLSPGWEAFEHGFKAGGRTPARAFDVPRWDGGPLREGALMVWREQGVGDEIRLASCYPDAGQRVGALIVETDPRLVTLFARSFPGAIVRAQATGPTPPDFAAHIPAGSLPLHLRTSLEDFPRHEGYLVAEGGLRARWRARLDGIGDGLRIGISWRSMNLAVGRLSHYTTLDEWRPVLSVPGVQFVNLQYGPEAQLDAELADLHEQTGAVVHRWADVNYTDDFEQVAALIAELDLVVGVGTTPALLAGALGRPVWMLALPDPMALGVSDYPWFPSLQRFPREWDQPWTGVMKVLAEALGGLVEQRG